MKISIFKDGGNGLQSRASRIFPVYRQTLSKLILHALLFLLIQSMPTAVNAAAQSSAPAEEAGAAAAQLGQTIKDEAFSWTGAYIGLNAGGIINDADVDSQHQAFVNDDGTCNHDFQFSSFLPGFQAGYLYQFKQGVVAGIEADFTYPDSKGSATCYCPDNAALFDRFTVKNRLQGSLRGRLGYALDKFLPFITAGVSFADLGMAYSNELGQQYSKDTAQAGWVLGGGLEWNVVEHVSVRAEYLYTDYGNALNMNIPTLFGFTDPNAFSRANLTSNTFRAAINYSF